MPITSLTWTSRQARTHNPHWMQASRLTRIAGWLASPCQRSADGKRLSVTSTCSAQCQNFESGSCEGARAGRFHLHADAGRALAGRRQHALALDLDHAGAAIAVGPVVRFGRMAQMRNFMALALCNLPDGLAVDGLDLLAIEFELDFCHSAASLGTNSSGKYLMTEVSGF